MIIPSCNALQKYTIDTNVMRTGTYQLGFFPQILKMSKKKMNQKNSCVIMSRKKAGSALKNIPT